MKTVYIYTGGHAQAAALPRPDPGTLVIAADSGYDLARACDAVPDILLGDMDSLAARTFPATVAVTRFAPEKNETDTMLAVDRALAEGGDRIVILGGLGGRLDHSLANLFLLEYLDNRGAQGILTDGWNRVRFLRDGKISLQKDTYRYFSLIAASRQATGIFICGGRYPLADAVLTRERQYAISNEFSADTAEISVGHGALFIIESSE